MKVLRDERKMAANGREMADKWDTLRHQPILPAPISPSSPAPQLSFRFLNNNLVSRVSGRGNGGNQQDTLGVSGNPGLRSPALNTAHAAPSSTAVAPRAFVVRRIRGPHPQALHGSVRGPLRLGADSDMEAWLGMRIHADQGPGSQRGGSPRDASEGKGPQRRLGRRLEEVAKAVRGGCCRLQMPLRLALGVRGTVAGHRLGALEEGGGGTLPPF